MGIVFRARDDRLGRDVALKCPWPHLSSDAVGRHRFLREARATSRLSHPTIVPVYEVFEDRELPWIAMELVEGKTLAEVLGPGEPLLLDQILQHAEDLTDALRAAHAKGVLHRDIKPSNVLLGADGRARLTDFGLARFFAPADRGPDLPTDGASQVTEEGKVVGTIAYMAPETLLGAPPDPRSDLFSLGVILYEMCTGRAAFGPSSKWDAYQAVLHREPAAIGRFNYEIPRSVERIVRKALAKRPDERYQDARDMLADIRGLRRRIASGTFDAEEELAVGQARRGWETWGLLGLSVASLGVAAWMGLTPEPAYEFPFKPRQLTSAPAIETEPAISPDGTLVAYVAEDGSQSDLWVVKNSQGGNPIRLTDDKAADRSPAWYPDGSAIAFVSDRGGSNGIWKIPSLGGSPTMLLDNAADPAISPDGHWIAFVRSASSGTSQVFTAPLNAPDKAAPVTPVDVAGWGHTAPAWSPDGKSIVFADWQSIWVVSAAGGRARQITQGNMNDVRPVWTSDGRSIVFTSDGRDGTRALWRVGADGVGLRRLTTGDGPERLAGISRKGDKLVFTTAASELDIGLFDRVTGSFSRFGAQRRDFAPTISPDGRRVIFCSERWSGTGTLAAQDLDGVQPNGPTRRLMERPVAVPRYSPDGKWIAFFRFEDGGRDIWIAPADGGAEARVIDDPADDLQPAWSPSGDRLAFVSARGGRSQIWTVGVSNGRTVGEPRRLTTGEATDAFPEWSPDGKSIAFLRSEDQSNDVWIMGDDGAGQRRLTRDANAVEIRWAPGAEAPLVSGTWGTGRFEIRSVDLGSGASKPLSPPIVGTADVATSLFDVALGGRLIAATVADEHGDIWIIEGAPGSF